MAKKKSMLDNPEVLRDIARGIGAGFQAYDPNNPFAGMGAALSATVGGAEERVRKQEDRESEQKEYDRRFAMQQEARQSEIEGEKAFRKGLISEEREYKKQETKDELSDRLEYLRQSLAEGLKSKKSELEMLREMRGNFNPLFGAFGGVSPSMGKLSTKPPYLLERPKEQ
jgi:hypothetical protein